MAWRRGQAYGQDLVRRRAAVVTRLRLDARLFAPPPPRTPRTIGRPRVVGERLPTLARRLDDRRTRWRRLVVAGWYGGADRLVEACSGMALWHHPGLPVVPVRWVLVRDPLGEFRPQAFLCTDLGAEPVQILSWFVWRWATEVTFAEARRHLGVETQRQWSRPQQCGASDLQQHDCALTGRPVVRRARRRGLDAHGVMERWRGLRYEDGGTALHRNHRPRAALASAPRASHVRSPPCAAGGSRRAAETPGRHARSPCTAMCCVRASAVRGCRALLRGGAVPTFVRHLVLLRAQGAR